MKRRLSRAQREKLGPLGCAVIRIVRAAEEGKGVDLSADEVWSMAHDTATIALANNCFADIGLEEEAYKG